MRLIDADALYESILIAEMGKVYKFCFPCKEMQQAIDEQPTIEPPTTTWLNPYSPYKCKHCGKHTDSKTPFCAWCGRRASNYEM